MRSSALAVLAASALACGRAPEAPKGERRQLIEGLTLSQSEDGRPAWTLRSREAVLSEDQEAATLAEPVMEFYRGDKAVSRVTARQGEISTKNHDVKLSSAVVLDSFDDKSRLSTEELLYSSARKRFETAAEVRVRRPEGELRGRGLEAKPDLSEIRIREQTSTLRQRPG